MSVALFCVVICANSSQNRTYDGLFKAIKIEDSGYVQWILSVFFPWENCTGQNKQKEYKHKQ